MRLALHRLVMLSAILAFDMADATCDRPLLDHNVRQLASEQTVNLCETYMDKVVLVVNTASKCGNTPQYEGLETLYAGYKDRGLVVLGFPSNDFLGQEPGTEDDIQQFCRLTYGIRFPMFEKTVVRGDAASALYQQLTRATGEAPRWNFHKYLIDRDGNVSAFDPRTLPEDPKLIAKIEAALQ